MLIQHDEAMRKRGPTLRSTNFPGQYATSMLDQSFVSVIYLTYNTQSAGKLQQEQ